MMTRALRQMLVTGRSVSTRLPRRGYNSEQRKLVEPLALNDCFNFLGGESAKGGGRELANIYPATGATLFTFNEASASDIDAAVSAASSAASQWQATPVETRAQVLRRIAASIRAMREPLAAAETLDVGKPLWECQADIDNCADVFDFYAGLSPLLTGDYCPRPGDSAWYTRREALGVCAAIGAWNFPFQMATFKSAPALLCGNAVVFKPAPLTPTSARWLAEAVEAAGAPRGLLSVVQGGAEVGGRLCRHPGVDKVSFTGSAAAGSAVMKAAAERTLPVTLELGGKSALIVFEDAEVEEAVKGTLLANFLSQGQVCSNAARVFVHQRLLPSFTERLLAAVGRLQVGDPFAADTSMGAMISAEQGERVLRFVAAAEADGAAALCGGRRLDMAGPLSGGFFLPPTVLDGCHDDMQAVREEMFGPVLTLLPFEEEEEVLRRANNTEFGLAGGIFTTDARRAQRTAAKLRAGSLYVNNYNVLPPGLPFGGFRRSGVGRENAAAETLAAYTQVKSVYVEGGSVELPFPIPESDR